MNKRIHWLISLGMLAANPFASAAVFDVSTVAEFRTALNAAANNNEDNTINLAAGTYFTTEDSGGSFLYNSTSAYNLTIQDDDVSTPNDVILDGDTVDEVLVIKSETGGGYYTLNGLTLQHGTRGARVEKGHLTINNSRFIENISTSNIDDGAGLLFNQNAYDLSIQNTQFTLNSVSGSRHGGAAYLRVKNLTITDSVFDQNSSPRYGGALYINSVYGNESAQITSSEFTNNTADSGGAVFSSSNNLIILDNQFQQNSASTQGGALYGFFQSVNRSQFIGNTSAYNAAALGGAAEIFNSIFKENSATHPSYGYGATAECQNCRIANNVFDNNSVRTEILIKSGYQSDSNIIANTVFLNTQATLLNSTSTGYRVTLKNNFFDPSLIGLPAEQIFQTDNIFSVSPGLDENYQLLAGAELIDAGYANEELFSLPATDIFGNSRIAGSAVDIGPMEYGSSLTLPQIDTFSLLTNSPKNLQDLTFSAIYTLFGERTLGSLSFDDGSGTFMSIELDQNGQFQHRYIEPGNKNIRLKIVDSMGEENISSINITINAQSISDVISLTKDACQASPDDCNIDASSFYDTGYAAAMTECAQNPSSCGVNTEAYITQGKDICIQDPSACGIRADFDYTQLPSNSSAGWKLLGTSEPILTMNQFSDVKVVWAQKNATWYAYSPDTSIASALSQKGIPTLTSINAYSGFWVTK
jgi:hypothetical protein